MFVGNGPSLASGSFTIGGTSPSMREQAELDRVAERIQSLTTRLGSAGTNLQDVANRTFGMTPPVAGNPVDNNKPASALALIHERLNTLNAVTEVLENAAIRFQSL